MSDNLQNYVTLMFVANRYKVSDKTISRLFKNARQKLDIKLDSQTLDGQDQRKKYYLLSEVNQALMFGGYPAITRPMEPPTETIETYVSSAPIQLANPVVVAPEILNVDGAKATQALASRTFNDNANSVQMLAAQMLKARFQHNIEQAITTIDVSVANALGGAIQ